ncbi:MAG: helix-turn-helix domain-containing protein [Chloroflexota bacterium]|nr:helix-turn-helix domain-containing protein [Chloroflexota bacterium]
MLSRYLYTKRLELHLSVSELARMAHISRTYIRKIENGEIHLPSLLVLRSLASALKVNVEELLRAAGINDLQSAEATGHQEGERLQEEEQSDGRHDLSVRLAKEGRRVGQKETERGVRMYLNLKDEDQRLIDRIAERLMAAEEFETRMIAEERSRYAVGEQPGE